MPSILQIVIDGISPHCINVRTWQASSSWMNFWKTGGVRGQRQHSPKGGGCAGHTADALCADAHSLQCGAECPHAGMGLPIASCRKRTADAVNETSEAVQSGLYPYIQGGAHHCRS